MICIKITAQDYNYIVLALTKAIADAKAKGEIYIASELTRIKEDIDL